CCPSCSLSLLLVVLSCGLWSCCLTRSAPRPQAGHSFALRSLLLAIAFRIVSHNTLVCCLVDGGLVVSGVGPPRHHRGGSHCLHDFAALVRRHIAQANDSVLRFRARRPSLKNFGFDLQRVVWPHRVG